MIEEGLEQVGTAGKEDESALPTVVEQVMLSASDENLIVRLDPDASLQQQMKADGFVPTCNEYGITQDGKTYMAQRAEHVDTGEVRVYYADVADAATVKRVQHGTNR